MHKSKSFMTRSFNEEPHQQNSMLMLDNLTTETEP